MVVEKELFTRYSSPNTLFVIARHIILSLFLTERLAVQFMQVCSANCQCNFCLFCFSFAVETGSLFSRASTASSPRRFSLRSGERR